jgi:hypothetical protein
VQLTWGGFDFIKTHLAVVQPATLHAASNVG